MPQFLYIKEEHVHRELNLNNRIKYTNKEYNITIFEIKETDKIYNFLELDDNIMISILNNENRNRVYIDGTIYLLHYPEGELSISYGVVNNIYEDKNYLFTHKSFTNVGSSGSPILNLKNKLIGLHRGSKKGGSKIAIFLDYPIKDFIKKIIIINHNITEL